MDYRWGKSSKSGPIKTSELNIPSDRVFSGLSENHNATEIGSMELKLWPHKDVNYLDMTFDPELWLYHLDNLFQADSGIR